MQVRFCSAQCLLKAAKFTFLQFKSLIKGYCQIMSLFINFLCIIELNIDKRLIF